MDKLRDAITAHKIKKFIVHEIKERIKRKPHILIDYGSVHGSIEAFLKHEKLRDLRKKLRSPFDKILDFSYINLVHEFRNINSPEVSTLGKMKIIKRKRKSEYKDWERILYDICKI